MTFSFLFLVFQRVLERFTIASIYVLDKLCIIILNCSAIFLLIMVKF